MHIKAKEALSYVTAIALAGTMCVPATASGAESASIFVENGLTYVVTSSNEVSLGDGGTAGAADLAITSKNVTIPQTVSHAGTTYTVTGISAYALWNNPSIQSVTIPATVTKIGKYAFGEDGVMDESGATPVYSGLEHIYFSGTSQLKYIDDRAFYNCYNLESFTIPASVRSFGDRSFGNCFSFKTLSFEPDSKLDAIANYAFEVEWQKGFAEPSGWDSTTHWTAARGDIFAKYKYEKDFYTYDFASALAKSKTYGGLETVQIPASVQTIGERAFANQRQLKSLAFDASLVKSFSSYCFAFCSSLEEVELAGSGFYRDKNEGWIYGYGTLMFACCTNLKSVLVKGEVKSADDQDIGYRMFDGCVNLNTVAFSYDSFTPGSSEIGVRGEGEITVPGYNSSSPTLYYRVGFFSSYEAAIQGDSPLDSAWIREDTPVACIKSGMSETDSMGQVVLRGNVPKMPESYDSWSFITFKNRTAVPLSKRLFDTTYAFPVKNSDLTYGEVQLSSESFWFDNQAHKPAAAVVDPAGKQLSDSDYQLIWERLLDNDTWTATEDFTSIGTLRARAVATGTCSGETATQFEIVNLSKGSTIIHDGITYVVAKEQTSTSTAELQVGDGKNLAISNGTEGSITIPASIQLEGSEIVIPVTSIAARAFGADTAENSCTLLEGVVLPEGVTSIGDLAFANASSLAKVAIPASVSSIGSNAFAHDTSLAQVVFEGSSCSRIGTGAFAYCSRLKSVELPSIDTFLGLAFQNCVMLSQVTFKGKIAGSKLNQFDGCKRLNKISFLGGYWSYSWNEGAEITTVEGSGSNRGTYRLSSNGAKWSATLIKSLATGKSAVVPSAIKADGITASVVGIGASAFSKCKATTINVKSTALTKASVKNSLKSSSIKTVYAPKSKRAAYKKLFTKGVVGKAVTIK